MIRKKSDIEYYIKIAKLDLIQVLISKAKSIKADDLLCKINSQNFRKWSEYFYYFNRKEVEKN